ncbi:MAG: hypothetical protein QF706_09155, partial [Roseibacillus sp.]|nr:hypothetical protein [Roseibacillus sp.]
MAQAEFLFLSTGVAATVAGISPALNVSGVTLDGTVDLELNTTGSSLYGVDPNTVRLTGSSLVFSVLGQTLSGNFTFEQVTDTGGESQVKVAVTGLNVTLGGVNAGLALSNGSGLLLLTSAGMAASLSSTVQVLGGEDLKIEGDLALEINTTGFAINEMFTVGLGAETLVLPAGPYLRLSGTGIVVAVAGYRLSGNFVFEQVTLDHETGDTSAIRIAATGVTVSFGDGQQDFLTISNGTGFFLMINSSDASEAGMAGTLRGDVAFSLPEVSISGTVGLEINRTGRKVEETFKVDNIDQTLTLEEGNYVRLAGTNVSVELAGQTLRGDFQFSQGLWDNGTPDDSSDDLSVTEMTFSKVEVGFGDGTTDFATVTQGEGTLYVDRNGVRGTFSGNMALAVPKVTLGASATVTVDTSIDRFQVEAVGITDADTGETTNITLNVLDQVVRADTLSLERQTLPSGESIVNLSITGLSLSLNGGGHSLLTVGADTARVVVNADGLGLRIHGASLSSDLPGGLSLSAGGGDANVLLNTTSAEFDLGDGSAALQAGPYVKIEVPTAALEVAGVGISGGMVFDQETDELGGTITRLAVDNAQLVVNEEAIAEADGALVILDDGLAGILNGRVATPSTDGGFSAEATIGVRMNTTGREVNQSITLGTRTFVIDLDPIPGELEVFGSALVNIGDFVTVELTEGTISGGAGWVFAGVGPAHLEEPDDNGGKVINPSARGILLGDARLVRSADGSLFVAEGTVQTLGLEGFDLSGTARVVFAETSGTARSLELPASGAQPVATVSIPDEAGTYITVDGLNLEIAGQILSGDFTFTYLAD